MRILCHFRRLPAVFCIIFTSFNNFYSVQKPRATKKVTKFGCQILGKIRHFINPGHQNMCYYVQNTKNHMSLQIFSIEFIIDLHLVADNLNSFATASKSSLVGLPLPFTVISCSYLSVTRVRSYAGESA